MPPKQKIYTPIKPLEVSTMTHEEEHRQYDISQLQSQMEDITILQRGTEVKMEAMMDANMNGLKLEIKGEME